MHFSKKIGGKPNKPTHPPDPDPWFCITQPLSKGLMQRLTVHD